MGWISIIIGVVLAGLVVSAAAKLEKSSLKTAAAAFALALVLVGIGFSSIRFVPENRVGVVIKNALGPNLPAGKIIAAAGEMGPQASILPPGWHFGYWPVIFDVELHPVVEIEAGEVGLVVASDGQPLPKGQIYAAAWSDDEQRNMLVAQHFLTDGSGFKGPQASVLKPGKHRLNPKLFQITRVPITNIPQAMVGVVKSNVGSVPPASEAGKLVERQQRGIWREPYRPRQIYLHSEAYEVTIISTERRTVRYTKSAGSAGEESEITVRSSDGFTFPVDVRIEYRIEPNQAPLVVANFTNDGPKLQSRLNSVVRSVFRNNAESVKALDYVQQRSHQESQSLLAIANQMDEFGVTVTAVRIGDVGDEQTLGELLKTQTDREIALQHQVTFQEQQRAAEQRKALTRTEQEAEEEKRLATARYEVRIAEEDKLRRIIGADAEAEAIRIRAVAQAGAFREIAQQIGSGNAALLEMLKVIGADGIQITPRVMVNADPGAGGSQTSAETVALIGTMLDSMMSQEPLGAKVQTTPASAGDR